MAKIVLSMDGVVLQEMALTKERVTIGRRPHNDIVIDNSTVSAEHAVIVTMLQDAFIEDLNSTNGTRVNGQRISKHFLKNNDVIELAKYKIRFVREDEMQCEGAAFLNAARGGASKHQSNIVSAALPNRVYRDGNTVVLGALDSNVSAVIKILNGTNKGEEIPLARPLTTIGVPGKQVAVVTRRGESYSLTHAEGDTYPFVNGVSIGACAYTLMTKDVIEVAGIQMSFESI